MPNIQEFEGGNLSLRPTETGVEARAGTARRIGMFYNQQASAEQMLAGETSRLAGETNRLGSETAALGAEKGAALADTGRRIGSSISDAGDAAIKYLDHQQISQGTAAWSTLFQKATQDWNDTVKSANPNDPTVAKRFMDSLEPALTDFKERGFYTEGGQKWAEAHVDALRQHMVEKTMGDMSTLAGQAAVVNQQQTINSLSSTVHSDPSSLDFSLAALKSSTEGMISSSPNLTGTQAGQVRSEVLQKGSEAIVKSAAIGYIEKTAKVPPWATDPKYAPYINGAELKMLEKAAQTQSKVNLLQDKQLETYQRQTNERKAEKASNDTVTKNVAIDPKTSRPIIKPEFFSDALEIAKMPDAPAGMARALIDWGEHQQNLRAENVVSDPVIKRDLTDRLFDPNNPTSRIDLMKAQVAGKLSNSDFQSMERLVTELETAPQKGAVWQTTMAAVKDALIVNVPGLTGKDSVGTANYATFMQSFVPQYLAKERAGTLAPNALDVKDPNSMISQAMAPFKRTQAQRMSDYVNAAGGVGAKPEIPNQSTRMFGDVPVPTALNGIAALKFNKAKMQWRDEASGKIYDNKGNELNK